MAFNCWSKQRSHCIAEVQDVNESPNSSGVETHSILPQTGYSQAKGKNPSAVSIQQLRMLIAKIKKLSQERCMTTEATTVEHQFKGRNLARTQLQLKIGLELIFRIQAGPRRSSSKKSPPPRGWEVRYAVTSLVESEKKI